MRAALVVLLVAAPAMADPPRFSLSFGVGHAYSLLGPRLELAGDHFGGFLAPSIINLLGDPGIAAGVRWTSGVRQGLVVSLHGDALKITTSATPQTLVVFAATVGYRFRWARFWAEAAAGPAFYLDSHYIEGPNEQGRVLQRQTGFGAAGGQDNPKIPDVELAVGFEL